MIRNFTKPLVGYTRGVVWNEARLFWISEIAFDKL